MKCLDCDNMLCKTFYHKTERWELWLFLARAEIFPRCKTFYHKTERWEGYCRCLKRKVYGDNDCQCHVQLDLFGQQLYRCA